MAAIAAAVVVVLLIGWTVERLTVRHRRAELHTLTDREITEALAPRPEPITTWPARDPRPTDTLDPE